MVRRLRLIVQKRRGLTAVSDRQAHVAVVVKEIFLNIRRVYLFSVMVAIACKCTADQLCVKSVPFQQLGSISESQ